ncbi:MAG: hypothetical protein M3340_16565, partial [Actinomycetota bacterium]|nr:hypothetical protein [Actinomycetota bacterium]
ITSGDLLIDGVRMNDVDPARRDVAIVFQNYALYPHMSVRQNLEYGLKNRGTPRPEIDTRVKEAARILEIARKEADERVARAQQAADEALRQAEAISTGLRRLGESLEGQAERILRDVQAGHRRLMADLRVELPAREPAPREPAREPDDSRDRELLSAVQQGVRKRGGGGGSGGGSRGNPFDDLEVPDWAERKR